MLTKQEIEESKRATAYTEEAFHEHDDCIRIAFEWLDAQKRIKNRYGNHRSLPLKHLIERWGGRYVSQADVDVAAQLHPRINGRYPNYNIGASLVLPDIIRIKEVREAFMQRYKIDMGDEGLYKYTEKLR